MNKMGETGISAAENNRHERFDLLRIAATLMGLVLLIGILLYFLNGHHAVQGQLGKFSSARNLSPGAGHILGTDPLGRDNLLLALMAGLNSFAVAYFAAFIAWITGLAAGVSWAIGPLPWRRGLDIFFKFMDSVPYVFMILLVFTVMIRYFESSGADMSMIWQILIHGSAIGLFLFTVSSRFFRDFYRLEWDRTYVFILRNNGMSRWKLVMKIFRAHRFELFSLQMLYLYAVAFSVHVGIDYLIEIGIGELLPSPAVTAGQVLAENRACFIMGDNYQAVLPVLIFALLQIVLLRLYLLKKKRL